MTYLWVLGGFIAGVICTIIPCAMIARTILPPRFM